MPSGSSKAQRRAQRQSLVKREASEIAEVAARLDALDPAAQVAKFTELPLSARTLKGLKSAGFIKPTLIQALSLSPALKGKDVLGAAKTGSGKTLAFLLPILETLWRQKWSKFDGIGAVVISPTRELALQTFECLAKVGSGHEMSAGLIIGGTTFETEQANIPHTNILICTPGRLLQHLDETPNFDLMNLQILVLDEADRILELGFSKAMNAIIQGLPWKRQTLLFSATQTNSVKDLARLSLNSPANISADGEAVTETPTPDKLVQAYIICPLNFKLNILYSFIKSHLTNKVVVFCSSCKQVRYIYEFLRRTRPGIPLMSLYGKQKHAKRMGIFNDFAKKKSAVLFATDIASRGLDFPKVDWVFQLDCPESVETYIHRVGRTARYETAGKALMTVCPSEEGMIKLLEERNIKLQKTEVAADAVKSITPVLQSLCASDPDLKYLAQKCFITYMRSIFLQGNKDVFDVTALPADEFAASLGLPNAPQIKFSKKKAKKMTPKAVPLDLMPAFNPFDKYDKSKSASKADAVDAEAGPAMNAQPLNKFEKLRKRKNVGVLAEHRIGTRDDADGEQSDDADGLFVKSTLQAHENLDDLPDSDAEGMPKPSSKKKKKQQLTKAAAAKAADFSTSHLKFKEDGTAVDERTRLVGVDLKDTALMKQELAKGRETVKEAMAMMKAEDVGDKAVAKAKRREKKLKKKLARKRELDDRNDGDSGGYSVTLGTPGSDDGDDGAGSPAEYEPNADDSPAEYEPDSEEEEVRRTRKKARGLGSLQDDEALALKLLGAA